MTDKLRHFPTNLFTLALRLRTLLAPITDSQWTTDIRADNKWCRVIKYNGRESSQGGLIPSNKHRSQLSQLAPARDYVVSILRSSIRSQLHWHVWHVAHVSGHVSGLVLLSLPAPLCLVLAPSLSLTRRSQHYCPTQVAQFKLISAN